MPYQYMESGILHQGTERLAFFSNKIKEKMMAE
jgi:hypothetical protein